MRMTIQGKEILFVSSTTEYGNLSFRWGEKNDVLQRRRAFLRSVELSLGDCVALRVVHGESIAVVSSGDKGRGMASEENAFSVDALMTSEADMGLFLLTADCLPLGFVDPRQNIIALAHISRQTAELGLPRKVIAEFVSRYGSQPEDIHVFAGPCIQKVSYILERPPENIGLWGVFAKAAPDGRTALDVQGFAMDQLVRAGVVERNIIPSAIDTAVSTAYFSHYRAFHAEEQEGRFATVLLFRSQSA